MTAMTVGQLKEHLDAFGDHVPVIASRSFRNGVETFWNVEIDDRSFNQSVYVVIETDEPFDPYEDEDAA